jgi:hypothetical protein
VDEDTAEPEPQYAPARVPAEIFAAVGAVAVAGGHVEFSLQRLLLRLRWVDRGGAEFDVQTHRAVVHSMMWKQLVDKINQHLKTHPRPDVAALLERADQGRFGEKRNDVIHAYWWLDGGPGIRANRIPGRPRNGVAGWAIGGDTPDLFAIAEKLFTFARDLEQLVPGPPWLTPTTATLAPVTATATRYSFVTHKPIPLQLDGEVLPLQANTPVHVEIAPGALATLG